MHKIKAIVSVVLFAVVLAAVSLACIFKPADAFSDAERRALAQLPEISTESITSGEFTNGFEAYTADQFPARDTLRGFKAWLNKYLFRKLDTNGLYTADGHISKIDDAQNDTMLDHAAERFRFLYDSYIKDTDAQVYLSVVPDKNYLLAAQNGYPSLDYAAFTGAVREKNAYMTYIDILPLLDLEDYYTTDTHWRQERITDIAQKLAGAMGADVTAAYTENTLDTPFYGVYAGQYALSTKPDTIRYLTSPTLDACKVTYYDTGMPVAGELYNMEKGAGKDPYELFLSGTSALSTIENPNAKQKRELVLFRDSFGGSLAPLLAEGYSKITVVDIRYIQSSFVGNFVDFDAADDVLFLYSTSLLNNSLALR